MNTGYAVLSIETRPQNVEHMDKSGVTRHWDWFIHMSESNVACLSSKCAAFLGPQSINGSSLQV